MNWILTKSWGVNWILSNQISVTLGEELLEVVKGNDTQVDLFLKDWEEEKYFSSSIFLCFSIFLRFGANA